MLIRRETLAAALPAVTNDDTRYFLSKVQIMPSGEVQATNGHIAIMAKDRHTLPDEDFPLIPGAPFHGNPSEAILLDATTAKRLIGATGKGKRAIQVTKTIQVSKNGSEHTHTFAATDLTSPMVATVETDPAENFPVLERVVPAAGKDGTIPLVLGVPVLEALLKTAKIVMGDKRFQAIRFEVPTDERKGVISAIRCQITGDDTEVIAVVMPCRE